ncbi:unnamed protein product [Thelazia callipaeda]|uniref:Uncharacterized protein n=1 Tax=Thelazia callipaeda TaxID=103827 RepID=A0A0N5D218_THECL|nr:unnamed protein product [Thelazia callipaeda]
MWQRSKSVLVQNIDEEENLKQSRRTFNEMNSL